MSGPRSVAMRRVVTAVALGGSACTSPSDVRRPTDADPVRVVMYLNGVTVSRQTFAALLPGDSLRFSAQLFDADGRPVSAVKPTIATHNPGAVSMDAAGMLRAVGRGSSWIVAGYNSPTRGLIADSTLVGLVCTTEFRAGLVLTVTDSATGTAAGLTKLGIVARSGTVHDSVFYSSVPPNAPGAPALLVGMAWERPGTWEVGVTAAGYAPWTRSGVVVTTDLCHVIPVLLAVRLQRQ